MGKVAFPYNIKCCGICANFGGSNPVLEKAQYRYYVESNIRGTCRFRGGLQVAANKSACQNFDPLPGFNA